MKRKWKPGRNDGVLLALAAAGLALFLALYPRVFSESLMSGGLTRAEILTKGKAFVESLGYPLDGYTSTIEIGHHAARLNFLEKQFGLPKSRALASDSLPVFLWNLRWIKVPDSAKTSVRFGNGNESGAEEALQSLLGDIRVDMDRNGNVDQCTIRKQSAGKSPSPADGSGKPPFEPGTGKPFQEPGTGEILDRTDFQGIKAMMADMGGEWTLRSVRRDTTPGQPPFSKIITWNRKETIVGLPVALEVSLSGRDLRHVQKIYEVPKSFEPTDRSDTLRMILGIIFFLTVLVLSIIYFVKRLRADLVDLKSGWLAGILVALGWALVYFSQNNNAMSESFWGLLLGFVLTVPFLGGTGWAIWILGESLTREVWPEKLATLDAFRRRRMYPEFGASVLRGLALALLGLGLVSLLRFLFQSFGAHTVFQNDELSLYSYSWPALWAVGSSYTILFFVATLCLFSQSLFERKIRKVALGFLLLVLLWSFNNLLSSSMAPFPCQLLINALFGLLIVLFFRRYDALTVLTGLFIMIVTFHGTALVRTGNQWFITHGLILFGILLLLLGMALIVLGLRGKDEKTFTYVPSYIKRAYEKERIQKELEIARDVQLGFLPRGNPRIPGLDISSFCIPAREVGGDYYDFIMVDDHHLGVVIGDVSGKGIPAAFYMTLTKGLLKSQIQHHSSPKDVLVSMNELFYDNAERGTFISMIYGVFDLKKRTLTFARAGHNPMVLRRPGRGKPEELQTTGIALGLEKGEIFARAIQEKTISIETGDVFLFYTDGLNEAQNEFSEEFGEDRLFAIIQTAGSLSADRIVLSLKNEIAEFSKKTTAHDDQTAVVVKIL